MPKPYEAVRISDRVHWVGAIDWEIRSFHGYGTPRGTTYNAYLITGEKVILVDTVKAPFREELLSRVASVVDPGDVSAIVSNHSEMDHSGSLVEMVDIIRPEAIYASPMGKKALEANLHGGIDVTVVKDGETLTIGDATLSAVHTAMIHWPDSMFTFLQEDGVLFSQDGFGMHLASTERFDDELDPALLEYEAAKYYANILLPYSPLIKKLVSRMGELDLPVKVVAPDHGPVWRSSIARVMGLYEGWAEQRPTRKAVIIYDTMWHSTEKMAHVIADGLTAEGVSTRVLPLGSSERSDVAAEVLEAGALLVGTPTMNNNLFPSLADSLTYLKGLRPKNLVGAAFGSYGWSGEAVDQANAALEEMGVELVSPGLKVVYVPDEEALLACRELAAKVAARLPAAT